MPTIRMEHVAKYYRRGERDIAAVFGIDLEIVQGEFVFVVGSRGAGKSTLLDLMAGTVKPDMGRVLLDGVDIHAAGKRRKDRIRADIGRIGQETELRRQETVYENLSEMKQSGLFRKKVIDRERADKALGLVGMAGYGDRFPRYLSPPENRRIQIAQAIMKSPDILLLDDFTDQMDDDTAWDLAHGLLNELNRRGTTIVMVTNSSHLVDVMRRRVVTLADGQIKGDVRRGRYGYIG